MLSKFWPWYRRRWFDNKLAEVELLKMAYRLYDTGVTDFRPYSDEVEFQTLVTNPISGQL
jgi:hypothetical protein